MLKKNKHKSCLNEMSNTSYLPLNAEEEFVELLSDTTSKFQFF